MKTIRLGNIATVDLSNVDKKTKDGEKTVKLCNFVDVYHNWSITSELESELMVATANENQIKRFTIKKGQVAITKDSETRDDIGIPTYIADDIANCVLGYHCALITPDETELDGAYLNSLLHTKYALKYFGDHASGSGQRYTLTKEIIEDFPVVMPDTIEEQKALALILTNINNKITLNNSICTDLEAMAKLLYNYWFVQFDFPDENGKPYKSSGGKMVFNKELNRKIPEGWSNTTLRRYIGRITNGLNPRKNFILGSGENYYVTIKSLVGTNIDWSACDKCDDDALAKINSRSQLQIGDVIFSAIGTIGRTYFIQDEPTNWNISETSFTLRASEDIAPVFFYSLLRSDEVQKQADMKAMGSTMRCLVMDALCGIPYIDIPVELINEYANKVLAVFQKMNSIQNENRQLIELRDFLLPMLMNGQIKIGA